jgi:polynucleotide 5'-hydroxyl-kinase GRC3/NOL9
VLEAVARARVTMVIGASDTGKTTLTAYLAGMLATRGETVAVVDADVGQSEIGPPTTVGLGRVRVPLARLAHAEVVALEFVGTTSPARAVGPIAEAAAVLVGRARAGGVDRILVDTSGLVAGPLGRWLKRAKIAVVRPDLVVVVARGDESEGVAREAAARPGCAVLRVAAATAVRRRGQDERRRHRARALAGYFAGAATVALPAGVVSVRRLDRRDTRALGAADIDLLVGLHDDAGNTRGIGRLLGLDATSVTLQTPVAADVIAAVTVGQERERG